MNMPDISVVAIVISTVALTVSIMNYRRKSGLLIKGSVSLTSDRDCDDKYVSELMLENLKDRAVTIFLIYLRVGHNYYVEIERFEDRPLVIRPYEIYRKQYGPIHLYGFNTFRVKLNPLLDDPKVPKRLVLSTSSGKYVVPDTIPHWSPIADYFRNYFTAIIRPIRTMFRETAIGSNIKYVVELEHSDGRIQVVPIHPEDVDRKVFKNFSMIAPAMASKDNLTKFLADRLKSGAIKAKSLRVYDASEWRIDTEEFYRGREVVPRYRSYLGYKLVGRFLTWTLDRSRRRRDH